MDRQANAPPQLRNLANFLRGKAQIKTRHGVVNGRRVDYFKGSVAMDAVLSPAYAKLKNVPPQPADAEGAERLLHSALPYAFYLRVDRGPPPASKDGKLLRPLQVNQMQTFEPELYYAWFYEGSQLGVKLAGLGMVVLMLAGVMFPLWPSFMRRGVWYLSVGVLGLFGLLMVVAVIRLIFWVLTIVLLPPGVWIFPNLFADVGFVDSFIPLWAWDVPPPKPKGKKTKKRVKAKGAAAVDADGDAPSADNAASAAQGVPEGGLPSSTQPSGAPSTAASTSTRFTDVN
ncbi:Translocation protein S62 [Malassezia sp. CBS 17886]|nr:Translocation protein S62 [Malassezia sp. CBS 17886]